MTHNPTLPNKSGASIANSQLTRLSPAERMALALAPKGGNFNTQLAPRTELGTSAAARARASI